MDSKNTCQRCGRSFRPKKSYYRLCEYCFNDTRPEGFTGIHRQRKAADHRYGGVSRLRDERRTLTLHGHATQARVIQALEDFLRTLYRYDNPGFGWGDLLQIAGLGGSVEQQVAQVSFRNSFVMAFVPAWWQWLCSTIGYTQAEAINLYYGFYQEPKRDLGVIAGQLGLSDANHANNLLAKAHRDLRQTPYHADLVQLTQTALGHV